MTDGRGRRTVRDVQVPLRRLTVLAAACAFALLLTGSAWGITVTASMVDGSPNVTWTQPNGYPDTYVDAIEVATAPDVDEFGYFVIDNVVGIDYFSNPADSTGRWQGKLTLQPGVTYYVHVEVYEVGAPTGVWSPAVPFTVPVASSDPPSSSETQPPSESGALVSPVAPVPTEPPPVAGPDYETRLRRSSATLLLGFRDRAQLDEEPPAPYKVCWTRPVGMACARRLVFDGRWDVFRLRVTDSVGRPQAGKRVVRITWRVGGRTVLQATLRVN